MSSLKSIRIVCVLFALFVGSIVYAVDTGIGKPIFDFVRSLPLGDKISHFFLMGTLAGLANLAFGRRTAGSRRISPGLGTVIVAIVVVAEEISQIWIPGRSFDLLDLAADFLGIAGGDFAARALWSRIVSTESRE
jgi:hypothetical protein